MNFYNTLNRKKLIDNIEVVLQPLKDKEIIIYGMGKIGKLLHKSLLHHNIEVKHLWDNNNTIVQKDFDLPISKPQPDMIQDKSETITFVTIFADNLSEEISDALRKDHFKHIIYEKNFIYNLIYSVCHQNKENGTFKYDLMTCHMCPLSKEIQNRCDIFDSYISQVDSCKRKQVIIPSMGVLITNKCNLTCEGCNHLRDLYKPHDTLDMESSVIINDLKKITESVDFIEKIVLVGGEAFVHKDVYSILKEIMTLDKIGIIHIITNGTIALNNEELFKLLSNDRVIVEISGYGDLIPKPLQKNVQSFVKKLKKYNINFSQMDTLQWFDFGGFEHRNFSKKEHLKVYKTCCFVSNDLFNGKIFKCSRSALGTHISKIPDYPIDYVDVRNLSKDELRNRIDDFLNFEYPEVCQHCNGTSTNTIQAGVQTKGKKK